MVRRLALVVLLAAGCSTPEVDAAQAERVAVGALAAAGLDGTAGEVERATVDVVGGEAEVWLVTVDVDGTPWTLGVDPAAGSVVRTFEPAGSTLADAQVEALATYRDHPAADAAATRRRASTVAVVAALLGAGYLALRRAARASAGP